MALFWTDWWLWDGRIEDRMPNLFAAVKKKPARQRTVRQAITEGWWRDVSPNMNAQALREFLLLVDRTQNIELLDDVEDKLDWSWEGNGCFTARSAYRAFFAGRVEAAGAIQIWRSRAPATCKIFAWLVARNQCWTLIDLSAGNYHTRRLAPSAIRHRRRLTTSY